jgi:hypothetical protein
MFFIPTNEGDKVAIENKKPTNINTILKLIKQQ